MNVGVMKDYKLRDLRASFIIRVKRELKSVSWVGCVIENSGLVY
jgi:hypothetical protein